MRSDAKRHRQMLIEAAARVFSRDGADVPLARVLAEAGLGRGTLYRHFKDRRALAIAVLEHPLSEMQTFIEQHRDDRTLLRQFLGQHGRLAAIYGSFGIIEAAGPDDGAFHELQQTADTIYDQILSRSIAAGTVDANTTVARLRIAMRMLSGMRNVPETGGRKVQILDEALELVLSGLSGKDELAERGADLERAI